MRTRTFVFSFLVHSTVICMAMVVRIFATTERDGIDFNLTYIPPTFNTPHLEEFDTNYMRNLYAVGQQAAQSGAAWQKYPPGFEARPTADAK